MNYYKNIVPDFLRNNLYKKKRKIYNLSKKIFQNVFWENNIDNLYYGHYSILKKYSKTILPYKINGEVQHGWSPDHGIMIDPNSATSDLKQSRFYVFNKFNKKKSHEFGFRNVYAIGAPFIYHPDIHKEPKEVRRGSLLLFPMHTTIYDTKDNLEKFQAYIKDIKKLAKNFASITVSLGWLDYKNNNIRAVFEKQNIGIISMGKMNDPQFLDNYIKTVKKFEYVSSETFSSAIFYSLIMNKKTFIYGNSFATTYSGTDKWDGMKIGYNQFYADIYPELMWENFNDKAQHHISIVELGWNYKKSPKELCELFEWSLGALPRKSIKYF
ncbi:MAG: hypothetical protein CMF99_01595 [Candidatus Marinimicrobia bacterium]|nr:hypothetical protein [Candidatus Neomarinimicrobiota bacterium]